MGNLVKEKRKKGQEDMKKLVELATFALIGSQGFSKGRGSGFGYQEWARGSSVSGCRQ